jgi:hypothetical protein
MMRQGTEARINEERQDTTHQHIKICRNSVHMHSPARSLSLSPPPESGKCSEYTSPPPPCCTIRQSTGLTQHNRCRPPSTWHTGVCSQLSVSIKATVPLLQRSPIATNNGQERERERKGDGGCEVSATNPESLGVHQHRHARTHRHAHSTRTQHTCCPPR